MQYIKTWYILPACAIAVASATTLVGLQPTGSDGTYVIDGTETSFSYPFRATTEENAVINVRFTLHGRLLHAKNYRVLADDCLESLSVNGEEIAGTPFCDYDKGRVLDLGGTLRAGENNVSAVMRNNGGPASLTFLVASTDPLYALLGALAFLSSLWAVWTSGLLRKLSFNGGMEAVFMLGMAVRAVYAAATSYAQRGYDVDGHIEYIRYVLDHWSVPAIADGWQFYQPPFYYMLAAIPAGLARLIGFGDAAGLFAVQGLSMVLSCATLLVAGWIITMIFTQKKQSREAMLAYALFAVFPATVFLSARINNDVLLELAGLCAIAFLLRWHSTGKNMWWIAAIAAWGLALLTKSNALLLAPVIAVVLAFRPKMPLLERAKLAAMALAILAVTNGWYVGLRALEGQDRLIPNITNLHSGLLVSTSWTGMAEFNPVRLSLQAYNNPWNDDFGRQHFWEYLFRSAFTGEFSFGDSLAPIFSALIALGIVLFLLAIGGIVLAMSAKPLASFPLWLVPVALLLGHAAFRQFVAPYSSSQDFRYSVLILAPLAVLCVQGMNAKSTIARRGVHVLGWSFVALSAITLFSVAGA